MIFEAKKTGEGTWQVYGRLPEDDREKMFVEFVSLATICLERESVLDTMIEAFEYVNNHSGEDGQISVLFRPKEKGGMA